MLLSAGAKVPTPSVINGGALRLEEVPRLATGRELRTKTTARTTFDRLDAHPPAGARALSFEFETTKGYRRKLLKTKCTESAAPRGTFWFVAEQGQKLSACSGVAYGQTEATFTRSMIPS